MDNKEPIMTVSYGNYFSSPIIVVGAVLLCGAAGILMIWLHDYLIDEVITFAKSLKLLFMDYGIVLFLLLSIGIFLVKTKGIIEFDPSEKKIRKGWQFLQWKYGKWEDFKPQCHHLAFQRYEQTYEFSYGGLYEKSVDEYIYDLRMIYDDNSFVSLVSGSRFRDVAQILLLGRKISEVYDIPLHDYVRELLKKERLG